MKGWHLGDGVQVPGDKLNLSAITPDHLIGSRAKGVRTKSLLYTHLDEYEDDNFGSSTNWNNGNASKIEYLVKLANLTARTYELTYTGEHIDKVYGGDGCQITEEAVKKILPKIEAVNEFAVSGGDFDALLSFISGL